MRRQFFLLILIMLACSLVSAVQPFGGNVTVVNSSRATPDTPLSHTAIAGNVTELNIYGSSVTQSWQGYFGNVTGTITLSDSSNNALYNWSLASPQGEIYASRNSTQAWTTIQCFNFTASGNFSSDVSNAGGTSQSGANLSMIEGNYSINDTDVDGVNETFNLLGAGTHDLFYTNNLLFSEGECRSTRLFSSGGVGVNNQFEEVLLYEPVGRNVVFASLLDENVLGFDNRVHDFEMLVLEDGHATDTSTTTYYFYVELE
jgi:hypothetical protein